MRKIIFSTVFIMLSICFIGTVSASENSHTVLFDQGHNQRFLIDDNGELQLSGLAEIIRSTGLAVNSTKDKLSDEL
ncbi:MAG: hypothetical protein PHU01_03305, partial [Desulfuromonadaceae bacterium]|nr:hypothetical protein [Desulfuromonadaceae bacterium]